MTSLAKQILLLLRDKFTAWWLLSVCDQPKTAATFAQEVLEEMGRVP